MGNLDPTAEEFRPRNPNHSAHRATLFRPPFFPYECLYAPTVQTVPFFNAGGAVPLVASPTAHVTSPVAHLSSSPTRSLLLSSVPLKDVSESTLRRELEVFGDVRGVQMEALREGMVTVHFYDVRHAEAALTAIQWHHQTRLRNLHYNYYGASFPLLETARGLVASGAVWAQYILPACDAVPNGKNQGTIVVFNLDSEVDSHSLLEIFQPFGPVKEFRHTPFKKNQRFVEFYDIRDAAKALKHLNGKEIHGKPVVIEFSRPGGGHGKKFFHASNSEQPPLHRKFWSRFGLNATTTPLHFSQPHLSSKKTTVTKGLVSTEVAMASVNLGEEVGNVSSKRNSVQKHNSASEYTVGSTKNRQQQDRSRHWKGKHAKKHEARFLIKEDATIESSSVDSRTTVMIKNIPNKYSLTLLLNMLDNHCIAVNEQIDGDDQPLSSYDFVYLPIDFNNKCNVGYGFVNMTSPEATLRLYKAFHLHHWEVFNSRKICEVTYARVQGLEALKEHFKTSKFPYEVEHYLPVVFSPPRNGRELTEPLPIFGHRQQILTIPIGGSDKSVSDGSLSRNTSSQNDDVEGDREIETVTSDVDRVSQEGLDIPDA